MSELGRSARLCEGQDWNDFVSKSLVKIKPVNQLVQNMVYSSEELENQAKCEHGTLHKERMMGQQTGDLICQSCGETFTSRDEVKPVEFRHPEFAQSVHALLVAIQVNKNLKLVKKYSRKLGSFTQVYNYALVDKDENSFVIAVASDIARQAISANVISLE